MVTKPRRSYRRIAGLFFSTWMRTALPAAPASVKTSAVRKNGGYVLNGTKLFITNGAEAEIILVFATTDPSKVHKGIGAFIVEKGTPGYSVGSKEDKLGIRASSTAELLF